ncbi:MAG TPA: ATP-binding protein, partial [Prolixibacteraceae bacterium]|nr:ATP-binding protein [Prolixibacteraceae bacterium]
PLKDYRKHRKEEQQLLETLINSIPVMITVYNETVDTITLNKATTEFTGWTNEDAAKTNIMELAYPDPDYRQKIIDFMQSLQPGYVDIIMRTKDGRDIETSWANVKIHDGLQVGVGFDISDRKRMENELISARKKAEKENQVQHAFLQNISHEVRTPMNSILGFTELLQKQLKGEKESEFINAISYNGKQLLRLIDDIVDFSRLDKKELTLQKEEVSIQHLVLQTRMQFDAMKTRLRKKHLKLNVKSEHNLNKIVIYTDLYRLQQIISNLLSNAVKYSYTGTIELGINIRRQEQDILFYVKDSGIGIKKEDHHRVFSRFNRFHDSTKAEFRGTGLGLAISRHLVELLGGEIWFESKAGKGSAFYFTHPFQDFQLRVESEKKPKHEKNYSLPDLTGITILIAEDDLFSYMLMNHMLTETKATILHAETGKSALDVFRQNKVDLVFLDIRLPEMDGYEVIKEMRKETKKTPIIAQTAHVLPDDRKKIKRNGFNYHASKPLSQNELFSILNRYIKKN